MARDTSLSLRATIDTGTYAEPDAVLAALIETANLSEQDRKDITAMAAGLVHDIRGTTSPGLMEVFLAEYGLSTDEGVALMCLAEALLRVPDAETMDALIEDKIAPSDWGRHMGHSTSTMVNASTWALMLTGRVLDDEQPGPVRHLRAAIAVGLVTVVPGLVTGETAAGHAILAWFDVGETLRASFEFSPTRAHWIGAALPMTGWFAGALALASPGDVGRPTHAIRNPR